MRHFTDDVGHESSFKVPVALAHGYLVGDGRTGGDPQFLTMSVPPPIAEPNPRADIL
jgi:hypothetical protein